MGHIYSITKKTALRLIFEGEYILSYSVRKPFVSDIGDKHYIRSSLLHFCTSSSKTESICWEGSSHIVLLRKLEVSLREHQFDEAWEAYNDFRNLYGSPSKSVLNRLIIELSYSSDPQWLQKACDLVFLTIKDKSNLLQSDFLSKLSLSLARAQMPVPTSKILRLMLEKGSLPPLNILGLVVLHMVKTEIGTHLASNILIELCNRIQYLSANKFVSAKIRKPNTMIFNLVLDACLRFRSPLKGQQIVELMAQTGVIADAHTIVIISQMHEMNGQRDELKKYKDFIDQVSNSLLYHYRQFYDSLLGLHFRFNDVDAASELILDMCRFGESCHGQKDWKEPQKPCLVPIGSHNLSSGLRIQILPELLQKDSALKVETREELIMYKHGKVLLSNKGIAKLVLQYNRCGRISDLSKLLINIKNEVGSLEESLCSDVIDVCLSLGWLENAHDILDDMELAGSSVDTNLYTVLLRAYNERKMFREAEALLKQIRKAGLDVKWFDKREDTTTLSSKRITSSRTLDLMKCFIQEMEEEDKAVPSVVYELNSSIYFFWKVKMTEDALRTYRKMEQMKIHPTLQTYFNMISGCSSLELYREITTLWGDMKRKMENGSLWVDRDVYEFLVLSFIRGGYFGTVMEVVGYMKERNLYIDKWMFKLEFLKFHKDLYRSLKASNARTEAQSKRIGHVRAFRKWVGIH